MALSIGNGGQGGVDYSRFGKNAQVAAKKLDELRKGVQGGNSQGEDGDGVNSASSKNSDAASTPVAATTAKDASTDAGTKKYQNGQLDTGLADALKKLASDLISAFTGSGNSGAASGQGGQSGAGGDFFSNLLNNLGLDKLMGGMGSDGMAGFQSASVQFSLNMSVVQSISTANGTSTQAMDFSFKMDLQWLQAAAGQGTGQTNPFGSAQGTDSTGNDPWANMMDYFSPKNTAGRILDFATSFYPSSKFAKTGDSEENRQAFADYMGKAIQKGFDQAMGILGKVDKNTQAGIDETHQRVFGGLDDFVKNGLDKNKQAAGTYANAQSWQLSLEMSYSRTTMTTYNSNGQKASNASATNAATPSLNAEA